MTDAPQILSITPKPVDPKSLSDNAPYSIVTSKTNESDNTDALWDLMFAWPTATNQENGVVALATSSIHAAGL